MNMPQDIVLLGPTCSGKSSAAIRIAQELDAEIVSCDSMQVYKGLEIGTAQPSTEELAMVPHHLIGIFDIHEPYDVSRFLALATSVCEEIHSRNKRAIIVGGTGLYAKALVYGHTLLPADAALFEQIKAQLEIPGGREQLEAELSSIANGRENIPKDILLNPRRLLRAVEVARLTGRTPWELNSSSNTPKQDFKQFIILPDLELLKARIRQRTAAMISQGWVQEAQCAIGNGLMETPTARQALGYRDIADFLSGNGPDTLADLETLLVSRTIHYARRQFTWFKHQHPGATFIPFTPHDNPLETICMEMRQLR